jgi:S-methylmethionine-dependent homocysteine/selenocysteine methylase
MSRPSDDAAMSYQRIQEKLARGEMVVLDGGVGTEILRRGVYWRCHGLEQHPEAVRQVHADYLAAGADVIKTDTFQLNRRAYLNLFHGLEHMRRIGPPGLENKAAKLTRQAVELARGARRAAGKASNGVAIAGVISPLEHSFRPDLAPAEDVARREHAETVEEMKSAGVDFILLESMNTIHEARAAAEAARRTGLPVWVSFVVRERAKLLGGEPVAEAAKALEPLGVDVVLVNCAPIEDITAALGELRKARPGPIGASAHIGQYDPPSWKFGFYPRFSGADAVPPTKYLEAAREWKSLGAHVIGGCCGTTPEHIRLLREEL